MLPIKNDHCDEPIYSAVYDKVKEKFLSNEELLPTNHGGYSLPKDSILARGKVLTKLLKQKDIQLLFDKSHWLDTNITEDRTPELKKYLINELDIDEIDFPYFSESITEEFMKSKNDDWVIRFYSELMDRDFLFKKRTVGLSEGILRNKPIIRLENNNHSPPFSASGKLQVYLPAITKSLYKTVKRSIAENKKASKFLKKIDISEPDIFAEINDFVLPKHGKNNISFDDDYFEDIKKLMFAFLETESSAKKETLKNELKDLSIIASVTPYANKNYWVSPSKVYLNTDDLRHYFDGYDNAYFIHMDLYKKFGEKEFEEFALIIDCNKTPRRIEVEGEPFSWEERNVITAEAGYSYHNPRSNKDYLIDGIENLFRQLTKSKSILLWDYILLSLNDYSDYCKERYFQGEYCWTPGSNLHYHHYESKFKKLLLNEKWLFDSNDNLVSPSDITLSALTDSYNIKSENLEILEKELGFKLNEIKEFEEKTGMKAVSPDDYELLQETKRKMNKNEDDIEDDEEDWEPDVLPDDVEPSISEGEPEMVESEDLSYQTSNSGSNTNDDENSNGDEDGDDNDGIPKNKIGDWGEKFVFRYFLENKYSDLSDFEDTELGFSGKNSFNNKIEIKWLNRNKEIGKGYDFVIIKNGEEVEYIEVKTTIKSDRTLHKITGTQ